MNKDKKILHNDDVNQPLIKDDINQAKASEELINKKIITLEKNFLLEQDNLLNIKKNIAQDIEKTIKRIQKDVEHTYKFSLEKFISELLPIIDNLERALVLADRVDDSFKLVIDKLEITLKLYLEILKSFGVKIINEINIPFNPEIHQAMSIQYSESIKENNVISILQNGYLLNNRLLRPAMVIVSKIKE